jgi:hypothetical protein
MNVEQPRVAEALARGKDRLVKPHPRGSLKQKKWKKSLYPKRFNLQTKAVYFMMA